MTQDAGRIPSGAHAARPWRIHELVPDFDVEDVWALPVYGGAGDFGRVMSYVGTVRPGDGESAISRLLWAIRWRLGEAFGWDDRGSGIGGRVRSLRERLPADLADGPRGPDFPHAPFTSLYCTDEEFAAEIANATMHGVMHLGWVPDGDGYRGQMAVLVKSNGRFGRCYMAAIKPFRLGFVYPAMMRRWNSMLPA